MGVGGNVEILGYKCFKENLQNRYGFSFQVGQIYVASGSIRFGTEGNGFHMCKNMEDTFRYFDTQNGQFSICQVKGSGMVHEWADEYNGYYDMYAVERLEILRQLTRSDMIDYLFDRSLGGLFKILRFVQAFPLERSEIDSLKALYRGDNLVLQAIAYYQEGDKQAYEKQFLPSL